MSSLLNYFHTEARISNECEDEYTNEIKEKEEPSNFWNIMNPYWYFSKTAKIVEPIETTEQSNSFCLETFELNEFGVEVTDQNTNVTRVLNDLYFSDLLEYWIGNNRNNIDSQYEIDVRRFVTIKLGSNTYDTTCENRLTLVDKLITHFSTFKVCSTSIDLSGSEFLKLLFSQTILINS